MGHCTCDTTASWPCPLVGTILGYFSANATTITSAEVVLNEMALLLVLGFAAEYDYETRWFLGLVELKVGGQSERSVVSCVALLAT